jgi:hypothetical protein
MAFGMILIATFAGMVGFTGGIFTGTGIWWSVAYFYGAGFMTLALLIVGHLSFGDEETIDDSMV